MRRNKIKLFVSGGVVGVGYICYRVFKAHQSNAITKLEDAHVALLRQSQQRGELQLQGHFEDIQRISDATTLPSILSHLRDELCDRLGILKLTEKLGQGKESAQALSEEAKLDLWEELKVRSFTHTTCSIMGLTLLVLCIRVQLNILGRHVYMDTARDYSNSTIEQGVDRRPDYQQMYIALTEFLPEKGLVKLILDARAAVQEVVGSMPFKQLVTIRDLEGIFETILERLNKSKAKWLRYMLPLKKHDFDDEHLTDSLISVSYPELSHDAKQAESLLDETRVILMSQEFKGLLMASYNLVLKMVMGELDVIYKVKSLTSAPLAKILPLVTVVGLRLMASHEVVELLTSQAQLHTFCAMVYAAKEQL